MPLVGCVTVPIMHVIDVVAVKDGHMPTAVSVDMAMAGVLHMRQVAFVVVTVVSAMGVTVVDVVEMALVFDSRVTARGSVLVGVIFVHGVLSRTHGFSLLLGYSALGLHAAPMASFIPAQDMATFGRVEGNFAEAIAPPTNVRIQHRDHRRRPGQSRDRHLLIIGFRSLATWPNAA